MHDRLPEFINRGLGYLNALQTWSAAPFWLPQSQLWEESSIPKFAGSRFFEQRGVAPEKYIPECSLAKKTLPTGYPPVGSKLTT
jgi:hypothetical protein